MKESNSKNQRNFKPRSPIPKQKLLNDLQNGLTLQEIGDKYNKSKSFISECCTMYNIVLDDIDQRNKKRKRRKTKKQKKSFVDIMYKKIRKEL